MLKAGVRMYVDQKLLIAKSDKPIYILPKMANRHGIISGATGTGKSLIAGKLIFDNPNAKFLFVAPTIFIFKEITLSYKLLFADIDFKLMIAVAPVTGWFSSEYNLFSYNE